MSDQPKTELFTFPEKLPPFIPELPKLLIKRTATPSSCDERETLSERIQEAAKNFDMSGEPTFGHDRATLRDGDRSLEVFSASDSLWWTDHARAYSDDPAEEVCLPSEDEGSERAQKYLKRRRIDRQIDLEHARPSSVSYSDVASGDCSTQLASAKTTLNVNYRWQVGDLPVFGPGAKLRVSFGHDDHVVQLVAFWRQFEESGTIKLIEPARAQERFACDPMFAQLCDADAKIVVQTVSLGYFALPPAEYQRFYVPVYRFEATAHTKTIAKQEFRRYVLAADVEPRHLKRQRMVADPARYFSL